MCELMTIAAALCVSALWWFARRNGHPTRALGTTALALWGAALMWSVDCVHSLMEGEGLLDLSADDAALGALILVAAAALYAVLRFREGRGGVKRALLVATTLAAAVAPSSGTHAATPAAINVDWRGLPQVPGVVRDSSSVDWGFANFVAFGPNWAYTAQDYAAKEHKKERIEDPELGMGLLFTGKIWAGSRGLAIREEFYNVSKDANEAKVRIRWRITSLDDKPMGLERAYVRFPLALSDFAGGTVGGNTLPEAYEGNEWIGVGDKSAIEVVSKNGGKTLRMSVLSGSAVIWDGRKDKQKRFELRAEFQDCKTAQTSFFEIEVSGFLPDAPGRKPGKVVLDIPPPPLKLAAGDDWCVFPWTNAVTDGSILDFSSITTRHAPAGQFGFARVGEDGHFFFENDPDKKPVRFVGGNLCFDANFLSKEQADQAVRDFKVRGWNTMRFHHIDVTITKDEWNNIWERRSYPEISPEKLDRLDYLAAECKKAGIYVTFDLYAMGCLGSCEGFDKPLNSNTIKAVVPIHKPAEDQWFRRAMEIFDHVNPYTGVKWKDEPQVLFVTLMNEDSIASVWWGAKDLYLQKFREWAELNGGDPNAKEITSTRSFAEFLYEVKANANRRMAKRLHDAGVRTLISGGNWWDNMAQVYEREELEVVDNHQYADHPQGSGYQKLPFHLNQTADVHSGHPTYATPIMMAPTRIFGKPFTVTEYNYCNPNKWRAEGGLMMGAYSSLQDWDALYRFAWSHSKANMFKQCPAKGFDMVTDPVSQLTERQIALLFGRGDVSPAKNAYAYGVSKGDAMGGGLGDMWAKGLFPHPFTQLAYTSRVGSFAAHDAVREPALPVNKVYSSASKGQIPKFPGEGSSDTGEIKISTKKGHITVASERSAGVCAYDKAPLAAGPLAVSNVTAFCSVSASSMDGAPLADSKRMLLFHITDVKNTGMVFLNDKMHDTSNWGTLPYLARTGDAEITLRNSNPGLKVYAVSPMGGRLREVPSTYTDGAYRFTARIAAGEGADAPTMIYEIAP
ncbi:MAG: hypothetical protein IJT64_02115 [Kiritimatiellae bacterium]|nr:hypothetical protein [Kiritimatiellia bacterium]